MNDHGIHLGMKIIPFDYPFYILEGYPVEIGEN